MKVEPVVLEGAHVRLEPLSRAHLAGLYEVGLAEELWRWIPLPVQTSSRRWPGLAPGHPDTREWR